MALFLHCFPVRGFTRLGVRVGHPDVRIRLRTGAVGIRQQFLRRDGAVVGDQLGPYDLEVFDLEPESRMDSTKSKVSSS
jgi:hypothetical protein